MKPYDVYTIIFWAFVVAKIYHVFAVRRQQRKIDRQAELLHWLPGLRYGEYAARSEWHRKHGIYGWCYGCGHLVRELKGHPVFSTTCTNPECGSNHVERGNEYHQNRASQ